MSAPPDALALIDQLPREHLPALLTRIAARLLEPNPVPAGPEPTNGNGALLTAEDVAARLHVSKRWVYRHANALHGVRLSEARVRFTADGIERYLAKRRGGR